MKDVGHSKKQLKTAGRRGRQASPWSRAPMVDTPKNRERYETMYGIKQGGKDETT
jgi:hypothetical protein